MKPSDLYQRLILVSVRTEGSCVILLISAFLNFKLSIEIMLEVTRKLA